MISKEERERLKMSLDEAHEWPCEYLFKCIVPMAELGKVMEVFKEDKISKRMSKTGKYVSVSATRMALGSEEVLVVYEQLASIPKIITL